MESHLFALRSHKMINDVAETRQDTHLYQVSRKIRFSPISSVIKRDKQNLCTLWQTLVTSRSFYPSKDTANTVSMVSQCTNTLRHSSMKE